MRTLWRGTRRSTLRLALAVLFGTGARRLEAAPQCLRYRVNATLMVACVPVFSKQNVGGAYLAVEQITVEGSTFTRLEFAAGSWPERLKGFNRFGATRETVREEKGAVVESAYVSFMASSREKNFSEARRAFASAPESLPLTVAHGRSTSAGCAFAIEHRTAPGNYSWRNCLDLAGEFDGLPLPPAAPLEEYPARAHLLDLGTNRVQALARRARSNGYAHANRIPPEEFSQADARTGIKMKLTKLHFECNGNAARRFRTAASLHSHTLHSRETLSFIGRLAKRVGPIRAALVRGEAKYKSVHGSALDLSRAWWTPPAAPHEAWALEKGHIERRLGLHALVSLTDHDDIEAPLSLRVLDECRGLPISVEWTVPYGPTFFHLGIHNLTPGSARERMCELTHFTACCRSADVAPLLESLSQAKDTLVVFNHPCWDESGIGREQHLKLAAEFGRKHAPFIHALELNGLRPWTENREVFRLAHALGKPVVSGGDRHALEPNAVLDLTNAASFAEFVEQVRAGRTDVLVTDQYREPFPLRILQSLEEILQDYDGHGRGWQRWSDRVFYRCDDGIVRPLTTLFANGVPRAVEFFVSAIHATRRYSMRQTLRLAFPRRQELAL